MRKGENDRPVFVYGTLMRGQRANGMLAEADYGGVYQLKDYAIYHLGSYPGIVPCTGETVTGELYYVSAEMLRRMDVYEVEGDLYRRVAVSIRQGAEVVTAEAYVYNRDITGKRKLPGWWTAADGAAAK